MLREIMIHAPSAILATERRQPYDYNKTFPVMTNVLSATLNTDGRATLLPYKTLVRHDPHPFVDHGHG